MRILYIVIIGNTMGFFRTLIRELIDEGNTVDIMCGATDSEILNEYREMGCKVYPFSCSRNPLDKSNIKAVHEIRKLVEEGDYDIVHCHTPTAAACTRIACRALRRKGLKVIYTAHGFHFYKGAPLKNWIMFFPIEWLCSFYTDLLITINQEDYQIAKKHLHARETNYVPGVGIDIDKFTTSKKSKADKRKELQIADDATVILTVGELIKRKNHELVIRALSKIKDIDWVYYIAGADGGHRAYLEKLISELHLDNKVFLLGRRNDIIELCECADFFILASFQEGLPVALMEAIAAKVPVISSRIRGSRELVEESQLFSPYSEDELIERIQNTLDQKEAQRNELLVRNYNNLDKFSIKRVNKIMRDIYCYYNK